MTAFLSGKNFSTITSSDIADSAIVSSKIASDAVTSSKILDDAITSSKILTDAVGSDALLDSAVVALSPPVDLSPVETQIAIQNLRHVIDLSLPLIQTKGGIADEYHDASGVNANGSVDETYDATGDFYSNAGAGMSNAIPVMTSNTAPSGVASQTGGSSAAYQFFDNAYTIGVLGSPYGFVKYDFGSGNGKVIKQYKIGARNDYPTSAPRAWTFAGSNDDSTYTTLDTQSGQGFSGGQLKVYNISNTTNYRYYRTNLTQTNGHSNMTFNSIEMFADLPPVNMSILSNVFTATTQPTKARVVLLHQPVDSVTLNTDLVIAVSRDGGTTFTDAVASSEGVYSTGINIISTASIDISGQPAGTSMVYKLTTANTKEQKVHGTWLQWS